MTEKNVILSTENLCFYYDDTEALHDIFFTAHENQVHSIMGPSGCGKSTLLRCFNRIHETSNYKSKTTGKILFEGRNVLDMPPIELRQKVGMVFQKPNPFPHMSIYDNVICGYAINNIKLTKEQKDRIVEESLRSVALWDEVKNNLKKQGSFISGGQQQRLCIARSLALKPKILLLDEPTSALDPFSTEKIEELLLKLKKELTIIIVTHNVSQAKRVSDDCTFMFLGNIIESTSKEEVFNNPQNSKTRDFIKGLIG